jgi:hypothetical protein
MLLKKNYPSAWIELDRADIELSFLIKHFDISNDRFQLKSISDTIKNLQKLYPYIWFTSREEIIKKERCTICNEIVNIRSGCGHIVGDIYYGEMCSRQVVDIELIRISLVKNPVDKYTVLYPQELEYNYEMLENLMMNLSNPYEKWDIEVSKVSKPEYNQTKGFHLCPCGSGKKFKKCCMLTGDYLMDHYVLIFHEKPRTFVEPMKIVGTWKNK